MGSLANVAVIGGGSWATAIVKMLCNNLDGVNWWMRNESAIDHILEYRHNPNYLSSVQFDLEKINLSTDLKKTIDSSDVIIIATPSAFLFKMFDGVEFEDIEEKIMISAVKGIVPEYHSIPVRFFHKTFGIPYEQIGIICGPCHAEEVALERLSYLTIACSDEDIATDVADMLACRYIKTAISDDLIGAEFAAILKNIYAIASGICHGLGYGDNFQAVLISNAIQELETFVDGVSDLHRDVKGSGYLGDLLVTSYSQFSRNRNFGTMIGKGYSVKAAQLEMKMVAEGYYAVKSLIEINKKFKLEIPIIQAVYHILYEKITPVVEMRILTDKLS